MDIEKVRDVIRNCNIVRYEEFGAVVLTDRREPCGRKVAVWAMLSRDGMVISDMGNAATIYRTLPRIEEALEVAAARYSVENEEGVLSVEVKAPEDIEDAISRVADAFSYAAHLAFGQPEATA